MIMPPHLPPPPVVVYGGSEVLGLAFVVKSPVSVWVCRCHIVTQFNEGLYDIIIAADELMLEAPTRGKLKQKHKHK